MHVLEHPETRILADLSAASQAENRINRWLTADARGWGIAAVAAGLILAACGTVLGLGIPHVAIYGHDTFIQLDGGWRVLNGQRPHADFYSAFGPVPYLISAAGLAASGLRVQSLVNTTSAVGLLLGIWAWTLLRNRLKAWAGLLFLLLTLSIWLAPFPLGEPFYMTGYAMQYNRLGYALASLILLELYIPARWNRRTLDIGGISTGIATALLLFIKVSFFFAAVGLIVSAYFLAGKRPRHFLSMIAGFALVAVPMLGYLHWDVPAMMRDLLMAASARKIRFLEGYDPFRSLFRNLESIVALLGLALLARLYIPVRNARGVLLFAGVVLAADSAMAMSNTQRYGFPLALAAMVILASRICRETPRPAIVLLTFVGVLPALSATANGWAMVLRTNVLAKSAVPALRFDAPHLAGLIFEDHNEPLTDPADHNGPVYVQQVNEGLALLRAVSQPQDKIACLWFANPFSYALLREPASGGSPFWAYAVNLTPASAPSADRILGNAELVIHPRDFNSDPDARTLLAITGPELKAHYRIVAESAHWILWRHL